MSSSINEMESTTANSKQALLGNGDKTGNIENVEESSSSSSESLSTASSMRSNSGKEEKGDGDDDEKKEVEMRHRGSIELLVGQEEEETEKKLSFFELVCFGGEKR